MKRALLVILVVVLVVVGGFLLYVTLKPPGADSLTAKPDPASSREEALERWADVEARDDETIDERCESWSMIHDEPVETTVVLLHGYTNCPYMYRRLGADLHEIGWNVLVPRYPYHGYVDKLSTDQGKLTAEDLVPSQKTVEAIVSAWQEGGASASVYEWPEEMGLGHNMVDDAVNTGKFDEIYPILMDLFTEGTVTTEPLPPGDEASVG